MLLFSICLLISLISCADAQIEINLNTPETLALYGFSCSVFNADETCEIKAVSDPHQLPDYFPDRLRNLTTSAENPWIFFAESSGSQGTQFELRSSRDALPSAKVMAVRSVQFYTEIYQGFGIWIGYEPPQWWYPGSDPDFKGEWLISEKSEFQAFEDMISITLANNKRNNFAVFTSIKIHLDPIPQLVHEIRKPEDFALLGFIISEIDSTIRNVTMAADLPAYFPETYKFLPLEEDELLMWVEVDTSLPDRRHKFRYHPVYPGYESTYRPYPAGVLIEIEGRATGASFGIGPHINWVGERNIYTPFRWQSGQDGWQVSTNRLMHLHYFIDYDGIGLFAYNNHIDLFSVFKRIRISYFYWEVEQSTEVTTTEIVESTTPEVSSPTTTTTTIEPETTETATDWPTTRTTEQETTTSEIPTTTQTIETTTSGGMRLGPFDVFVVIFIGQFSMGMINIISVFC